MFPKDTKVQITKSPAPMFDHIVGKIAKASDHFGSVSGNQMFVFDGACGVYLPEESVKTVA